MTTSPTTPSEIDDVDDAEDWPRCDHRDVPSVRLTNASQVAGYNRDLPHVAATTCTERACIMDALAWIERSVGEHGVWIDANGKAHITPPAPALASASPAETFALEGDEFTASWTSVTPEQIDLLTDYAETLLGAPDTLT